jgi:hypothetical protein
VAVASRSAGRGAASGAPPHEAKSRAPRAAAWRVPERRGIDRTVQRCYAQKVRGGLAVSARGTNGGLGLRKVGMLLSGSRSCAASTPPASGA